LNFDINRPTHQWHFTLLLRLTRWFPGQCHRRVNREKKVYEGWRIRDLSLGLFCLVYYLRVTFMLLKRKRTTMTLIRRRIQKRGSLLHAKVCALFYLL